MPRGVYRRDKPVYQKQDAERQRKGAIAYLKTQPPIQYCVRCDHWAKLHVVYPPVSGAPGGCLSSGCKCIGWLVDDDVA